MIFFQLIYLLMAGYAVFILLACFKPGTSPAEVIVAATCATAFLTPMAALIYSERKKALKKKREDMTDEASAALVLEHQLDPKSLSCLNTVPAYVVLTKEEKRKAEIMAWTLLLDRYLDDGILDEEEEKNLKSFQWHFQLTESELELYNGWTKLEMMRALMAFMKGAIPQCSKASSFILKGSEKLLWIQDSVPLIESVTRRSTVGGGAGLSVRVARGLYLRTGAFKSQPMISVTKEMTDYGQLGITTEHIYFSGQNRTFRIPYKKIVSVDSYSNGFGIWEEGRNAQAIVFQSTNGWFFYNLITNAIEFSRAGLTA